MDPLQLENSPTRKAQSNKLAVFSSIENRGDILEGRKKYSDEIMKSQNIRPLVMDNNNSTKRYSIPQNYKDSFYAIHHIQRSIKENERLQEQQQDENNNVSSSSPIPSLTSTKGGENMEPTLTPTIVTPTKNKKLNNHSGSGSGGNNRARKRTLAPDHNKSTAAGDSPANGQSEAPPTVKRKKSRQHKKPTLYQTCEGLWPPEQQQSLGELSHDNIKALSNLLKVRLSQAKFKMMAKLDQDNELFTFLAEEYVPPRPKPPFHIKLKTNLKNKSTMSVVGNGKNLFSRNKQLKQVQQSHASFTTSTGEIDFMLPPSTPKDQLTAGTGDFIASPHRHTTNKTTKERKKRTPRTPGAKVKRNATPKRKSAAADVAPVTLSDGSSVFICEPCHKKYKNRNGLAYHLERCKYAVKSTDISNSNNDNNNEEEEDKESPSHMTAEESIINCICSQNDEHGTMVQCDKCRTWLHSDCVGLTEDDVALEDVFHCGNCKPTMTLSESQQSTNLLQCLLEAQASGHEQSSISSQEQQQQPEEQQLAQHLLQNMFNNQQLTPQNNESTPAREEEEEDDELFSMPMEFANNEDDQSCSEVDPTTTAKVPGSTQLHVWEDFSFSSTLDKTNEPWSTILDDNEEPFSTNNNNYDTDIPSSSWTMTDIGGIFSQPPSLLFSDATMSNALEEVSELNSSAALIGDLVGTVNTPVNHNASVATPATPMNEAAATPMASTPLNNINTPCDQGNAPMINSTNTPIHTADGLWFQFANFDDDYQES